MGAVQFRIFGILIVKTATNKLQHVAMFIVIESNLSQKLQDLHWMAHDVFHIEFLRNIHYRICIVCDEKRHVQNYEKRMRMCGQCKMTI